MAGVSKHRHEPYMLCINNFENKFTADWLTEFHVSTFQRRRNTFACGEIMIQQIPRLQIQLKFKTYLHRLFSNNNRFQLHARNRIIAPGYYSGHYSTSVKNIKWLSSILSFSRQYWGFQSLLKCLNIKFHLHIVTILHMHGTMHIKRRNPIGEQ